MRHPRGLSARLLFAIGTFATLHLAVFAVLLVALYDLRGADRTAHESARVALAAGATRTSLRELQSAERAVAIAGPRPAFLHTWETSAAELRRDASALERQLRARGPAGQRSLAADVRGYLAADAAPLVALARSDPAQARRQIALGADAHREQALDMRLGALSAHEQSVRQERRNRASTLAGFAWIAGGVGVLATLVCAIGFLAYVRRSVLVPLRGVAAAARALAAGDLRVRVPQQGAGEVGELARTFDRMAASLEESRDALERQNAELAAQSRELVEAVRSAREAEHAKDEFFALVSHELRTPLTSILGYVELMLGEDDETAAEERAENLEVVQRNAQRLLRLVGDLLFAAQIEGGALLLEPGTVDLPRLVRDAIALARPRADDAGVALTSHVAPLPPTGGDRDRLAQVLDNLVSNAIKFTPPGGSVAVRLDVSDGAAQIQVSDTGRGIDSADLPRLFDRFYRAGSATARAVPGLGLGLTIVRAIVEGHGGSVGVRSEVSVGTTFTVVLPLRAVGPGEQEAAPERYSLGGR